MKRITPALALLGLVCAFALVAARDDIPAPKAVEAEFSPVQDADFEYGGTTINVYRSVKKDRDLYAYDPLFSPVAVVGKLLTSPEKRREGEYFCELTLALDSPQAAERARAALKNRGARVSARIPYAVTVDLPDELRREGVRLQTRVLYPGGRKSLTLTFVADDADKLDTLARTLRTYDLMLRHTSFAPDVKTNTVNVSTKVADKIKARYNLDGKGAQKMYVRRSELADIVADLRRDIEVNQVIEAPEKFDAEVWKYLLDTLLADEKTTLKRVGNKWDADLLNADDFAPELITKAIDDHFNTSESEVTRKINVNAEGKAKALVKGIPVFGEKKGSFTHDKFKRDFAEHGVRIEREGKMWVPKELDVCRISSGFVDRLSGGVMNQRFVGALTAFTRPITLRVGSHHETTPGLLARLEALENKVTTPIGTILPYGAEKAPDGYLACDGREMKKADYPELFAVIGYAFGGAGAMFNLPDTRGMFLRGAGGAVVIDTSEIAKLVTDAGGNVSKTVAVDIPRDTLDGSRTPPKFVRDINPPNQRVIGSVQDDSVRAIPARRGINGTDVYFLAMEGTENNGRDMNTQKQVAEKTPRETRPKNLAVQFIIRANP